MTEKEYMANSSENHQAYWLQFATSTITNLVDSRIGEKRIIESKDKWFNDIPLEKWDQISKIAFHNLCDTNFKINGRRSASLSCGVCAAKAYAKTIRDKHNVNL